MHIMMIFANVLHHEYFFQKIHVRVSDKGINEWKSPDVKKNFLGVFYLFDFYEA